ncbi:hypothetical protein DL96DRAFT_1666909 [Flagelloscypha sp. PMI_526]|nr:hypothetical protein DL96DRAFT_1666909 [Flagelloscypha sp. PMI_526]
MSASSGIGVSDDLTSRFASAVSDSGSIRFMKISIQNESLVHESSIPSKGTFEDDLNTLQDILEDNTPAYILAKTDTPSDWLAVFYVPDSAKVRDKMLYASTRASLTKSLGSTLFSDSIFATSKADITPDAYAAHRRHISAPKPMSSREQELADIREAEREAGSSYQGMRARASHVGTGVGLNWSEPVAAAIKALSDEANGTQLVVITIDGPSETLTLEASHSCSVDDVGKLLPQSDPCYAVLGWTHSKTSASRREIVFMYSCPSNSPIKHRMLYSSGSSSVYGGLKSLLDGSTVHIASRKVETSEPSEIDESFLISELGLSEGSGSAPAAATDAPRPFARPKGPGRKR